MDGPDALQILVEFFALRKTRRRAKRQATESFVCRKLPRLKVPAAQADRAAAQPCPPKCSLALDQSTTSYPSELSAHLQQANKQSERNCKPNTEKAESCKQRHYGCNRTGHLSVMLHLRVWEKIISRYAHQNPSKEYHSLSEANQTDEPSKPTANKQYHGCEKPNANDSGEHNPINRHRAVLRRRRRASPPPIAANNHQEKTRCKK